MSSLISSSVSESSLSLICSSLHINLVDLVSRIIKGLAIIEMIEIKQGPFVGPEDKTRF